MTHPVWNPQALRGHLNAFAPFTGAGIVITHIAEDASEIRVEMPLTESNLNLVGTHFGGSLYALVDPHLMILVMQRMGPDYIVWDKEACIDFRKPGTGTVRSVVRVTDEEIDAIRAATANGEKHLPKWTLEILDEEGGMVATVLKTLYVRRKRSAH